MAITLIKDSASRIDYGASGQLINATIGLSTSKGDIAQTIMRAKSGGSAMLWQTVKNSSGEGTVSAVSSGYDMAFENWQNNSSGLTQANLQKGELIIDLSFDASGDAIYGDETEITHTNGTVTNYTSQLPQGKPWWNLFSPNSPAQWQGYDTSAGYDDGGKWSAAGNCHLVPRLKRFTGATKYFSNGVAALQNYAYRCQITDFEGYDHEAEELSGYYANVYSKPNDSLVIVSWNVPNISDIDWTSLDGFTAGNTYYWGLIIYAHNIYAPTEDELNEDESLNQEESENIETALGDSTRIEVYNSSRTGQVQFYNNVEGWDYIEYRVAIFTEQTGVVASFPMTQTKVRYYNQVGDLSSITVSVSIYANSTLTAISYQSLSISESGITLIPIATLAQVSSSATYSSGLSYTKKGETIFNIAPSGNTVVITPSVVGNAWTYSWGDIDPYEIDTVTIIFTKI